MSDERIGHYRGFGIYRRSDGTMYGTFSNEQRGRVYAGSPYAVTPAAVRADIDGWYEDAEQEMIRRERKGTAV